jgi:hypothetical protein
MTIVTAHRSKISLSRRIKKAVAWIIAIGQVKKKRQPGLLKGKLRVGPEFFEPLPETEYPDKA